MILLSVVISLGLARLLETHAQLLKRGDKVRWSPTYLAWLLILLLSHIDLWASLWQVHEHARWNAADIGATLAAAALLFYASIFATPDINNEVRTDLWTFHLANRRRYLGALLGYMIVGAWLNVTLMRETFSATNATAAAPAIVLMLVAIFIANRWIQRLMVALTLVLITLYFAQYLPAIG